MGNEWPRLLRLSLVYLLLVAAFPLLIAFLMLFSGKGHLGIADISIFIGIQGWAVVTIAMAVQLGNTMFKSEHQGAWDYVASLPLSGLRLVWMKMKPRLIVLILWCLVFDILLQLPAMTEIQKTDLSFLLMFSHPLQVLFVALFWFIPSSILAVVRDTDIKKKNFMGLLTLPSMFFWIWIFSSFFNPGFKGVFILPKIPIGYMFGSEVIFRSILVLLLVLSPLIGIALRAFRRLSSQTPEVLTRLFFQVAFPFYLMSWLWLIGSIITGGVR